MTINLSSVWRGPVYVVLMLLWAIPVSAQTFNSGSTGADGAFSPTSDTVLSLPPNGVFNFTTVNIPAGVTVTFTRNAANTPVTMLATGDVTVAGTISVNGSDGAAGSSSGPVVNPGGLGGPGGFSGGQGVARGITLCGCSAGQGPGGGGTYANPPAQYQAEGNPFVSLIPLFGGSGAGGFGTDSQLFSGASGGGGGGAIVIASSTRITIDGSITANGGRSGTVNNFPQPGGSGGAIRLAAPQIAGTGILRAQEQPNGHAVGAGRIRLEAFSAGNLTFTGDITPSPSVSFSPMPTEATLVNVPRLRFASVAGVAPPAVPSGSYSTADVSLPSGATNPVTVTLDATNIPVGTVFRVKLIPQSDAPTTVSSLPSVGAFSNSTATATLTLPPGQVSVLNAFGTFTLPAQVAALYPLIDGEPIQKVQVAAHFGEPSTVTFITRSGKEVRADQLFAQVLQ